MTTMAKQIAERLDLSPGNVRATLRLLDKSNTVPFIARYRKEQTGNLDEVKIRKIAAQANQIKKLEKRREKILETIQEQKKLTDKLKRKLQKASSFSELEDLYAPYQPRRTTRATRAREAGLEPLAQMIKQGIDPRPKAAGFCSDDYPQPHEAVGGARDILAEEIADDPQIRRHVRQQARRKGRFVSKKRRGADGDPTYAIYRDFSAPVNRIKPHQVLAIRRGEKDKELSAGLELNDKTLLRQIVSYCCKKLTGPAKKQYVEAIEDGYKRLLHPAIERQIKSRLEAQADRHAIANFSHNLKNLLMQPPLPGHVVLGLDPGLRNGCKIAVVGTTGKLLETDKCFVHDNRRSKALIKLRELVKTHNVELIAIGNGTGCRETEKIVAELASQNQAVQYAVVNEAGASVYSASKIARREFPELDLSYRGAISIGRRLQDPLAELVKIPPQSIGVGMYQHDVNQTELQTALEAVVEDVVNSVGVDLNSASIALLQQVAGIGPTLAENILEQREKQSGFSCRKELKKVSEMGDKTYEQCAGFLRIRGGKQPLDNTGIHPENYPFASTLLETAEAKPGSEKLIEQLEVLKTSGRLNQLAEQYQVGRLTLEDIINGLKTPGRDPREQLPPVDLRSDILSLDNLKEGMILTGTVRNVVDFGAFVDIGLKNDGLLHISQMAERYIADPHDEISIGDQLKLKILSVDSQQNQVSLSTRF